MAGRRGGRGLAQPFTVVLHQLRDFYRVWENNGLGQDLFAAAREPKSFWLVPGAGHNDIAETAGAGYRQHLQSFYECLRMP